ECEQLQSAEAPPHDNLSLSIDPVHLKHRLGEIDAYYRNIFHRVLLSTLTDKNAGRVERRPRHQLQSLGTSVSLGHVSRPHKLQKLTAEKCSWLHISHHSCAVRARRCAHRRNIRAPH